MGKGKPTYTSAPFGRYCHFDEQGVRNKKKIASVEATNSQSLENSVSDMEAESFMLPLVPDRSLMFFLRMLGRKERARSDRESHAR